MGLFSSSDPAKAEQKLAVTEAKHEQITIKNAMKEVVEAEAAAKLQLKAVETHTKVHGKASDKAAKAAEKLREATATHESLAGEEQKELDELNARKSKHAELEEQLAQKKVVVERLKERHAANNASRNSPTSTPVKSTGPSAAAGGPFAAPGVDAAGHGLPNEANMPEGSFQTAPEEPVNEAPTAIGDVKNPAGPNAS